MAIPDKEQILLELGRDPVLAHAVLFGARHTDPTPDFHREIITAWHSSAPSVLTMAFRGAAKSTLSEEAMTIFACFQRTRNALILGESEQRAVERLRTIKNIIETNEFISELFGIGPGDMWTETKITLSNGTMMQAYGRGQSLRGVKHLSYRPDLILMDDLEDNESVATPEARAKTMQWFTSTVMPALAPGGRIRMVATPLHPNALAPTLARATNSWKTKVYPVIYRGEDNEWRATWPERYSVGWALQKQRDLVEIGEGDSFVQEYMCQATNPATQVFTPDMIRVVSQHRSWHATYAMYDPARTTHKSSATTGKVVWSWVGRRLVIWAADAKKWMPSEIVEDIFNVDAEFSPVAIGVEETGLNEFLLQPLRTEQVKRGHIIPLRPLHAPKGKLDFIRALQPYFRAGEVEFAREMPELRQQLLGFPTGDIDAPNALAYALKMKMGQPVFDGLHAGHIAEELFPNMDNPLWLAVNSDGQATTAVLCQMARGTLSILRDWLAEGPPGDTLADIMQEVSLSVPARSEARVQLRVVCPKPHFDSYGSIGLRAAARRVPVDLSRGGDMAEGREEMRALLRRQVHGVPALQIAAGARWTLRALAGGYCKEMDSSEAVRGPYRVLVEGVEAFAALLRGAGTRESDNELHFDYTSSGAKFMTSRPRAYHG